MRNEKTFCLSVLGYASRRSGPSFFITEHLFQPGITGWGEHRPGRQTGTLLVYAISSKVLLFPCSVNMFSERKCGKKFE